MGEGARRNVVVAGACLVWTALVVFVPHVRFLYRVPDIRVILDTQVVLVGALVSVLCIGRYQRQPGLGLAMIIAAMVLLASAEPVVGSLASLASSSGVARALPRVARLGGAALLAGASLIDSPARLRKRAVLTVVTLAVIVLVIATTSLVASSHSSLPLAPPGKSDTPRFTADPAVAAIALLASVMFGLAATLFAMRAERTADPLLSWLGTGCVLSAFSSIHYALYPYSSVGLLHSGDPLRAAAMLCWMLGCFLEIQGYWTGQAASARDEERRAIARDLHDGLAQEVALIASLAEIGNELDEELQSAARRALLESRRVVGVLAPSIGQGSAALVAQSAATSALRANVGLRLEVRDGRRLSPREQEALSRIVAEAVNNAGRHGHASMIHLELEPGSRLRVTDDGQGFDLRPNGWSHGFGLTSMRERAEEIGANFEISSAPGEGTTVEISWY